MKKIKLIIIIFLLLFSGCFSKNTNYYMLNNANKFDAKLMCEVPSNFYIEVGPIDILDYLKRDQVIIKDGENKITISDTNLWITSLDNQIKSALKLGLSSYINYEDEKRSVGADICEYPCNNPEKEKLKLYLFVNSFEYDTTKKMVYFNANMQLFLNKNLIDNKTISLKRELDKFSYSNVAYSMSELLSEVTAESAKMICQNS